MSWKLVPLRIPNGWAVMINHFGDEDPVIENGVIVNNLYYCEDILWIESMVPESPLWTTDPEGHILDLGWYPDSDPDGRYRLILSRKPSKDIVEIESKDRQIIRQAIEYCLELVHEGTSDDDIPSMLKMIMSKPGKLATGEIDTDVISIKAPNT